VTSPALPAVSATATACPGRDRDGRVAFSSGRQLAPAEPSALGGGGLVFELAEAAADPIAALEQLGFEGGDLLAPGAHHLQLALGVVVE
jgi:hypothetical protein